MFETFFYTLVINLFFIDRCGIIFSKQAFFLIVFLSKCQRQTKQKSSESLSTLKADLFVLELGEWLAFYFPFVNKMFVQSIFLISHLLTMYQPVFCMQNGISDNYIAGSSKNVCFTLYMTVPSKYCQVKIDVIAIYLTGSQDLTFLIRRHTVIHVWT